MLFILLVVAGFTSVLKAQVKVDDADIEILDINRGSDYQDIIFNPEVLESNFSGVIEYSKKLPSYTFNDVDLGGDQLDTDKLPYKISFNIEYIKGIKTKVEGFCEDGNIWHQIYFNKIGRDGVLRQWHQNGNRKASFICKDGIMLDFADTNWYANGNIKHFSNSDGINKTSKSWYKSGVLGKVIVYTDKISESFHEKSYLPTGELYLEANFNSGRQTLKKFFKNGSYFQKGDMINTPLVKVGEWQMWFENGQIELESYYDEKNPNIKIGTWNYYDVTGKLIKEESYRLNELIKTTDF